MTDDKYFNLLIPTFERIQIIKNYFITLIEFHNLQENAQKVRDLRRVLEDLRHEKEATDAKSVRADELEETVRELRQGNRSLEEKIAR